MEIQNSKNIILVVDDSRTYLVVLSQILKKQGYKVETASNGKQALKSVQSTLPDLILLDIQMPEMNGYEVCQKLKADDKTREIPIIFISGLNKIIDKLKAFSLGGVDYISKPFKKEDVLARVETHLKLHRLQQQLAAQNQELQKALEELRNTQEELIQAEKMAALGQLIAGVAHEINNPLSAINSSVMTINNFLTQTITQLPEFFRSLSEEKQQAFFALLQTSLAKETLLSTKEERELKRKLISQLKNIEDADIVADTLVDMGIYDNVEEFLSLLQAPDSEIILDFAYKLSNLQRSSKTIETASQRASKVVFALKKFARFDQSGQKVEANITDGIETVLTLFHNKLKHDIEVIKHYAPLPPILCYPDELNQVWTNLIQNALQAMDYKGTLTIKVSQQDKQAFISMTDSGKGIAEEIKEKIFEPFFTTKGAGEGSGLGLDIVRKIIEKHEGNIAVESQPGKTTFTVSIPIH
ncbi:ATPase [Candidatus Thiomargarita nelsonii]|uniref:histidine kinase n=1 Tax=Candidatus Thiomargarita nelsonii TaxID=1003181 RepID=A0A0A6PKT0_9GAMM|nr:ATPase [Candidatus Thiomargarita nelsonii]